MNPPTSTRAPQGAPFLLVAGPVHIFLLSRVSHRPNSPEERHFILRTVDLIPGCSVGPCSRAQLPRTPVVADSGRAAYAAALSLQRMDLHLTEFQ
jgi:hypothetical protein